MLNKGISSHTKVISIRDDHHKKIIYIIASKIPKCCSWRAQPTSGQILVVTVNPVFVAKWLHKILNSESLAARLRLTANWDHTAVTIIQLITLGMISESHYTNVERLESVTRSVAFFNHAVKEILRSWNISWKVIPVVISISKLELVHESKHFE